MSKINKNYSELLNALEFPVLGLKETSGIFFANSCFEKFSGYSVRDVMNYDVSKIFESGLNYNEKNTFIEKNLISSTGKKLKVLIFMKKIKIDDEELIFATLKYKSEIHDNEVFENFEKIDFLTGVLSRSAVLERFNVFVENAKLSGGRLVALAVKLDRIKSINQYAGYDVGDTLIFEAAKILKNSIPTKSAIGRIAGNKFFIIYGISRETESAAYICKKIVNNLSKSITIEGKQYNISANVGVSLFPQDGAEAKILMDASDKALEESEIRGYSRFQFFNESINKKLIRLNAIDQQIPQAIKEGGFCLNFQPKVFINDKSIIGAEALLRWENKKLGIIPPGEFIPRAEALGAIIPLGSWVLEESCAEAKKWMQITKNPIQVAVNVSPKQLAEENFVELVLGVLEKYQLPPQLLDLELTEYSFLEDSNPAVNSILEIKKKGVTFSLDDFGTGYSSLSQLASYPVDTIKIDQSLISGITKNDQSIAILKAIVSMAREIGIKVLAEGVEKQKELEFLISVGCSVAQGHYFHKPLDKENFRILIKNQYEKIKKI